MLPGIPKSLQAGVQSAGSASYTSLLRMSRVRALAHPVKSKRGGIAGPQPYNLVEVRWENFAQQTDELVTAMERCFSSIGTRGCSLRMFLFQ